jgi:hypothetical protein
MSSRLMSGSGPVRARSQLVRRGGRALLVDDCSEAHQAQAAADRRGLATGASTLGAAAGAGAGKRTLSRRQGSGSS